MTSGTTDQESLPQLQWVNADLGSIPAGHTAASRKTVRRHVMREHRRKRRLEDGQKQHRRQNAVMPLLPRPSKASEGTAVPSQSNPESAEPPYSRQGRGFELSDEEVAARLQAPSHAVVPWNQPGRGSQDPFDAQILPINKRMQGHLHYCE